MISQLPFGFICSLFVTCQAKQSSLYSSKDVFKMITCFNVGTLQGIFSFVDALKVWTEIKPCPSPVRASAVMYEPQSRSRRYLNDMIYENGSLEEVGRPEEAS